MGDTTGSKLSGRVRSLVADQLGVEISEVIPGASILDDLGADSLDVVELVMSLEDAFDIEIADDDADNVETVGSAVALIQAKITS